MSLLLAASVFSLSFVFVLIVAGIFMQNKILVNKRINVIAAGKQAKSLHTQRRDKDKSSNHKFFLFKGKWLEQIANDLSLAAIPLRAEEFIMIWVISALGPAALVALFNFNIFVCTALIAAGTIIPPFLLHNALKKRMVLFDKQLGDALAIIGNCLRAGFSFNQAIESISREMQDPIAKEFAKTLRDIKYGLSIEKALANMVERLKNNDLELIVSAVLIQRQVGGNLSEILDSIADTIKERIKLKGEIKVLTATGRTSGMIVGMLPVFIMGVLMIINPGYVSMFFNSTIGLAMLTVGVVLEITGFIIVKKIVDIKF